MTRLLGWVEWRSKGNQKTSVKKKESRDWDDSSGVGHMKCGMSEKGLSDFGIRADEVI